MIQLTAVVSGKVQGVMYRTYIQEAATNLGLVGYTKNEPNSTVLVVAQGTPDILKEFVEYLYEGSSLSSVSSVAVDWGSVSKTYHEFSVLH
ncbi:MAG: acylphosphatase [Candidatus Pacebacteria bacterium]|nr:acylphosphatase [Candidatus Paceibacterota bacterium]MBP9843224.1 acylphosphatase [Candidatus Paceibacterota bacterium]